MLVLLNCRKFHVKSCEYFLYRIQVIIIFDHMEYYFITGTSTGIGKAIAERLLVKKTVTVFGFSRRKMIEHPNYRHITMDFSNLEDVLQFEFPEINQAERIVLINNAGVIGDIGFVGNKDNSAVVNTYNINIVSPSVLINRFIKKYQSMETEKTILNISSGAGRHAIAAWSEYCASKAALDMFSQTIAEEQTFLPEAKRINIFSVAPGIVDTAMQDQIRDAGKERFPYHETFVDYKSQNLLTSPEEVAVGVQDIIENPARYSEVILDLRNM